MTASQRAARMSCSMTSPMNWFGPRPLSNDSGRLERAIAAALNALGLQAIHQGQSGQTDIVAEIVEGPSSTTTVIIDAKSAADGAIREGRINFDTLRGHKVKHYALLAAVVWPDFEGERPIDRAGPDP
jgi:hypothetical protein